MSSSRNIYPCNNPGDTPIKSVEILCEKIYHGIYKPSLSMDERG